MYISRCQGEQINNPKESVIQNILILLCCENPQIPFLVPSDPFSVPFTGKYLGKLPTTPNVSGVFGIRMAMASPQLLMVEFENVSFVAGFQLYVE